MALPVHGRLTQSLAFAHRLLFPVALDQFDLNLPPPDTAGSGFTPAALNALGTLYLQAELEQAGVIAAAEALADARQTLDLPSERAAERLEGFARRQRDWYDQASRQQLFARVFGLGAGATNDGGGTVNRDFEQRFLELCSALEAYAASLAGGRSPAARDEVRVRSMIGELLSNLELRRYGNTVFAARRVQTQLEAAIEVLSDRDVQAIFGTRGFWPTLQRIVAPNTPDFARIVTRAQSGQRLFAWIAGALEGLSKGEALPLAAGSPVFQLAFQWLAASGIDARSPAAVGGVR